MRRTGKFYRKNEAELVKQFGLKPTKNSGAGWVEKEDGENEDIIAQLKSTDAESIKLYLLDLKKLFYHAAISHKKGLFIIQFLQENEEYILMRHSDVYSVLQSIIAHEGINYKPIDENAVQGIVIENRGISADTPKIKTGSKHSRNSFYEQREKNYSRKRK